MSFNFQFDSNMLQSLVGGRPVLDNQSLNIRSLDEAEQFILSYGYDLKNEIHQDKLWKFYRRALNYIRTHLLREGEKIPSMIGNPDELRDLRYLLIYASTKDINVNMIQAWSCAVLRVIHVLVHLENDLFSQFSKEIQSQILTPIEKHVHKDPVSGIWLGRPLDSSSIRLEKFVIKSFKSSESSINKLLAKPSAVAFTILDKIGVRFVTKHLFDVFRVLRYLSENHLINFAHGISDESNNTLFPLDLFMEVMDSFSSGKDYSLEEVDRRMNLALEKVGEGGVYRRKPNMFSAGDYKFLKFITRRLIRVDFEVSGQNERKLNFFYPYEVQIMNYQTYLTNLAGSSAHEKYKSRQKEFARNRILGFLNS